ncbi:hypothetical protein ACF0H5_010187 [Mactra antiquata]
MHLSVNVIIPQTLVLFGDEYNVFICMELTQITEYSYYYYLLWSDNPPRFNYDRISGQNVNTTITDPRSQLCLNSSNPAHVAAYPHIGEYHVLIKNDSVTSAIQECPPSFFGEYVYTLTDLDTNTESCGNTSDTLDVCTDYTTMYFNNSGCNTIVAYTDNGTQSCLVSITSGDIVYHTTYNQDNTVDGINTFRFTCFVSKVASDGSLQVSQTMNICKKNQAPDTQPQFSNGSLAGLNIQLSPKPKTTSDSDSGLSTGAVVGITFGIIIFIIIIIILVCIFLKCRKPSDKKHDNDKQSQICLFLKCCKSPDKTHDNDTKPQSNSPRENSADISIEKMNHHTSQKQVFETPPLDTTFKGDHTISNIHNENFNPFSVPPWQNGNDRIDFRKNSHKPIVLYNDKPSDKQTEVNSNKVQPSKVNDEVTMENEESLAKQTDGTIFIKNSNMNNCNFISRTTSKSEQQKRDYDPVEYAKNNADSTTHQTIFENNEHSLESADNIKTNKVNESGVPDTNIINVSPTGTYENLPPATIARSTDSKSICNLRNTIEKQGHSQTKVENHPKNTNKPIVKVKRSPKEKRRLSETKSNDSFRKIKSKAKSINSKRSPGQQIIIPTKTSTKKRKRGQDALTMLERSKTLSFYQVKNKKGTFYTENVFSTVGKTSDIHTIDFNETVYSDTGIFYDDDNEFERAMVKMDHNENVTPHPQYGFNEENEIASHDNITSTGPSRMSNISIPGTNHSRMTDATIRSIDNKGVKLFIENEANSIVISLKTMEQSVVDENDDSVEQSEDEYEDEDEEDDNSDIGDGNKSLDKVDTVMNVLYGDEDGDDPDKMFINTYTPTMNTIKE